MPACRMCSGEHGVSTRTQEQPSQNRRKLAWTRSARSRIGSGGLELRSIKGKQSQKGKTQLRMKGLPL